MTPVEYKAHRFQSARPVKGATVIFIILCRCSEFQSARPVKGATPFASYGRFAFFDVSIRAPREGRDSIVPGANEFIIVSIRAPREGRDDIPWSCRA